MKLVSTWEDKFSDAQFYTDFKQSITDNIAKTKMCHTKRRIYIEEFLPEIEKVFVESKALMYPQLLPQMPFRGGIKLTNSTYSRYSRSEEK